MLAWSHTFTVLGLSSRDRQISRINVVNLRVLASVRDLVSKDMVERDNDRGRYLILTSDFHMHMCTRACMYIHITQTHIHTVPPKTGGGEDLKVKSSNILDFKCP